MKVKIIQKYIKRFGIIFYIKNEYRYSLSIDNDELI